ncbi:hypothetical protein IC582_006565 [Cucumis melo]
MRFKRKKFQRDFVVYLDWSRTLQKEAVKFDGNHGFLNTYHECNSFIYIKFLRVRDT